MTHLVSISLENEMDLSLAYKRSMLTASMIGLTVSTQTTFSTAISEVCREVIDKANDGNLILAINQADGRFYFCAQFNYISTGALRSTSPGIAYARKLVPVLEFKVQESRSIIELRLGIPRAMNLNPLKVLAIKSRIETEGAVSAYEEVKLRNAILSDLNLQRQAALEQANEMDKIKTEFLSIASHELNSPLTVLLGLIQMANAKRENVDMLQKVLPRIEDQTKKIIALVRQLMDVSKLEHGTLTYELAELKIADFFESISDGLKLLVPAHDLSIQIMCQGIIQADYLRLEQVISNLINNAAKYSTAGSKICLHASTDSKMLNISVKDEGIGMTPQGKARVFEKFYREEQVERKYNGLGMGLYIASKIINDHHGKIDVESEIGKGSTFILQIPL